MAIFRTSRSGYRSRPRIGWWGRSWRGSESSAAINVRDLTLGASHD